MSWFTDIFSNTVKEVIDSGADAVDRFVQTKEDKAAIELEFQKMELAFQKLELEAEKQFRDTMLKYEGAAKDVPKSIVIIRSLIRPVATIFYFVSFMFFMAIDLKNIFADTPEYVLMMSKLPDAYWVIFGIILGFWFGGKIGENIVDKLKANS